MAVYFGMNGNVPEPDEKYSGKYPGSGPEEYQVLILAFVIPFLTYYIIVPFIPVALACLADEMMYSSNSEIIFSYLQNHRDKIFPALAIGIAGTGGVLKKRKTVLSVCCLILSPFVMAMNMMHSL
ncbi:hypothetical protein [Methanoplanus limicola]|uniref:hypothetical protein n=1 Tax=Methanoplanus limicola TaxID=2315 RepID=UPI0012F689F4|nr:hypothetical protein [Methanoplanus limicola]